MRPILSNRRLTGPENAGAYNPFLRQALWNRPGVTESGRGFLCVLMAIGSDNRSTSSAAITAAREYKSGKVQASLHGTHDGLLADGTEVRIHLENYCIN